jgi:hypothetical protein
MLRLGFDLDDYEIKGHPIRWFSPQNQMSVPRVHAGGRCRGRRSTVRGGHQHRFGIWCILAAREIGRAFQRNEFSFKGYRRRVLSSALGQTLIARWIIAYSIYPLKWKWFQILVWWRIETDRPSGGMAVRVELGQNV